MSDYGALLDGRLTSTLWARTSGGVANVPPRWYVCRTRARAEKRVDRLLSSRGIESYVPVVEQVRQWSDRTKRIGFPLFPGYVFARFRLALIHELLGTPGIVTVVQVNGHPTPLRDEELESVRVLVCGLNRTGELPKPVQYVEVGEEVIVTRGPFVGVRGVLAEVRGRTRVVVRLSVLRQAVSIELPRGCVQAV